MSDIDSNEAPENGADDPPPEDVATQPPEQPAPGRGGGAGRGLAAVALLVALAAAGGAGYLWWMHYRTGEPEGRIDWSERIAQATDQLESRLQRDLAETGRSVEDLQSRARELDDGIDDALTGLRSDLAQLESRLDTLAIRADSGPQAAQRVEELLRQEIRSLQRRVEVAEKSVSRLAGERRDEDDKLLVAEAEFLLRLASARLSLFEDPGSAVTALRLARQQLAAVDDPLYGGVRETLTREIQRLENLKLPDRAGISGHLAALADEVAAWPLRQQRRPNPGQANVIRPDSEEQGWWARFRGALAEVAVVHRDQADAAEVLTVQQENLLRENLRLQLRVAELAALRGDAELYGDSLDQVRGWIETYFRTDAAPVAGALERIGDLAARPVAPDLPTIGQALRELRSLRASAALAEDTP